MDKFEFFKQCIYQQDVKGLEKIGKDTEKFIECINKLYITDKLNFSSDSLQFMLDNCYNQDFKNSFLLQLCCCDKSLDKTISVIKLLVENGADINYICYDRFLINYVIFSNRLVNFELLQLILELGAIPTLDMKCYNSCIKTLKEHSNVYKWKQYLEIIEKHLAERKEHVINLLIGEKFLIKDIAGIVCEYIF